MSEPLFTLHLLDYLAILAYLAGTMLIGYWFSKSIHSSSDFFLAGRHLPWWAVGFSLVATDIGGTDIVGLGGMAHAYGMAAANFDWIGCVPAMLVGAFVFIPHFWRCGITTVPELLERRFDVRVRSAVSLAWFVFMACNLGVMLVAAARFMAGLADWDPYFTIVVVSALVAIYTCSGGLAAVVYTDVLQGTIMIGGCLIVTLMGFWEFGGWGPLQEAVQNTLARQAPLPSTTAVSPAPNLPHFDLVLPVDTPSPYPWTAILFGLTFVVSPAYWIGNQSIVQRSLAARSEYEAKAAYVWGALLKNIIPLVIVVPGLMALVRFPHLEASERDHALSKLIATSFGPGVRGVFVAAFLAALMSSVDSYLNSATTLFTNDFYRRFWRPQADERRLVRVGRTMTAALTLWGVLFAVVLLQLNAGIYAIFQTLMAFIQGPAFAVLLTGLLTRRAVAGAAFVGFLCGVFTTISLFLLNQQWFCDLVGARRLFRMDDPFLYFSMWAFFVTVLVTLALSYGQRAEPADKLKYVLTRRTAEGTV
jgi:SSS family solute:Na+ symporter